MYVQYDSLASIDFRGARKRGTYVQMCEDSTHVPSNEQIQTSVDISGTQDLPAVSLR